MKPETIKVDCRCPICGRVTVLVVNKKKYYDWLAHKIYIQDAFPDLAPDQREALISGFCPKCWDSMLPEEPEEE